MGTEINNIISSLPDTTNIASGAVDKPPDLFLNSEVAGSNHCG